MRRHHHHHRLAAVVARSRFVDPLATDQTLAGASPDDVVGLLRSEAGRAHLQSRYAAGLAAAARSGRRFVLIAPTRGIDRACGRRLGLDAITLADLNRRAIALLTGLRGEPAGVAPHVLVAGALGRSEPVDPAEPPTARESMHHNAEQIWAFASAAADLVVADGLAHADEAVGIARAAERAHLPSVIGLVPDEHGRLADGEPVRRALSRLHAEGRARPILYRLAQLPDITAATLPAGAPWRDLVRAASPSASSTVLATAA